MADIKVPKTPKKAFNPDRPPSGLITSQVEHLEAALGMFSEPGQRRTGPRTEGEAAEYIAQLTAQLHPQPGAAAPENPVAPGVTAITRARAKSIPRRARRPSAQPAAKSTRKRAAAKTSKTKTGTTGRTRTATKTARARKARQAKTTTRKRTRRTRGERG
jgi:hypothetical protein